MDDIIKKINAKMQLGDGVPDISYEDMYSFLQGYMNDDSRLCKSWVEYCLKCVNIDQINDFMFK